MNTYEGMFIISPQLSEGDIEKVIESVQDEIKKNEGEVIKVDRIGRQHMSYSIKKFHDGYYFLLNFKGQGRLIDKMKAKYRINDNILRHLIVKQ